MEDNYQEHRHIAAEDFLQSLSALEEILQPDVTEDEETAELNNSNTIENENNQVNQISSTLEIDLSIWEEAVADIEKYLQDG
ncbi:MAG: hypothetical protein QNJ47_28455 [Nostocaceae cyanobacterium]|nr:hypothetical protein [Nostocaceae cyanobacterium]